MEIVIYVFLCFYSVTTILYVGVKIHIACVVAVLRNLILLKNKTIR